MLYLIHFGLYVNVIILDVLLVFLFPSFNFVFVRFIHIDVFNCSNCEAARVNTMTGGLDLSFGFPRNGKIPHPHQVT